MKKKILISRNIPLCNFWDWQDVFELDMPENAYNQKEYIKRASDAHYIIDCQQKVDKELLKGAKQLIAVNSYGVGYDSLDLPACREAGVIATNTPTAVTEATAELAMGLLLALCRRIPAIDAGMRAGTTRWGIMKNAGTTLYGKTIGIVGLGRIGKSFSRRALAMGMQVYYYNRNRLDQDEEKSLQVSYLPLKEMLSGMDVISLHTPLSDSSFHLIDKEALSLMKKSAFLINTARGKVVDEQALVNALEEGRIAGAGLDVFEHEPRVHPGLLKLENTVLLPHIGTETHEVCQKMFCEALEGFMAIEEGKRPANQIE